MVFTHRPSEEPTWPYQGFDYEERKEELLEKLRDNHSDVDFVPATAQDSGEAKDVVKRKDEFDGFLVYIIGTWTGAPDVISESGKPTILVDDLYAGSGEFLMTYPNVKEKNKVIGTASSNFGDVNDMVKVLKVKKKMSESKILLIRRKELFESEDVKKHIGKIEELFGTEVVGMSVEKLKDYYEDTADQKAKDLADKWTDEAIEVKEPSQEEIVSSAKMYFALRRAMKENEAIAVTIDCFDFIHEDLLFAYPCLAFFQLNNEGSTGVCEADLNSAITQLLVRYITEEVDGEPRPGYVSDPVIDLSTGKIIYAHCMATNRVFGPGGPENPYIIRSHAETQEGASVQSLLPLGRKITTAKVNVMDGTIRVHEGETVGNVQEEKGCRTKLAAEANVERLIENWKESEWHRVTFYGEWRDHLEKLASFIGLEVIEEDR